MCPHCVSRPAEVPSHAFSCFPNPFLLLTPSRPPSEVASSLPAGVLLNCHWGWELEESVPTLSDGSDWGTRGTQLSSCDCQCIFPPKAEQATGLGSAPSSPSVPGCTGVLRWKAPVLRAAAGAHVFFQNSVHLRAAKRNPECRASFEWIPTLASCSDTEQLSPLPRPLHTLLPWCESKAVSPEVPNLLHGGESD